VVESVKSRGQVGSDRTFIGVKCRLRSACPISKLIWMRRSLLIKHATTKPLVQKATSFPSLMGLSAVLISVSSDTSWSCRDHGYQYCIDSAAFAGSCTTTPEVLHAELHW